MSSPSIRCAIYTRKSTEEGLDQAFNSLDAQREACEAYVKSQASEGWRVVPTRYDDGGFSGGTLERPALHKLLEDVDAGRVDTIVVYKIDRLTRSLSDFSRIVERLEAAEASFVSVTQSFNTTTSMGRLTLNVLLSFAQFEREVTGERNRDKIAASKAKGMWMGGMPPLGYDLPTDPNTRTLTLNPNEAERVRLIFTRYLELKSVSALEAWLDEQGIRSKAWTSRAGKPMGGARLSRGALFHLLRNRIYLGEIQHGSASFPADHPPIVPAELFDQVQVQLAANCRARTERPTRSSRLPLSGKVFDVDGHPMSPSFGYGRGGKIYRYYVSAPLQQGRRIAVRDGALRRVKAETLDELAREHLAGLTGASEEVSLVELLRPVRRVEIAAEEVRIHLERAGLERCQLERLAPHERDPALAVLIAPVRCQMRGGRTWLVSPPGPGRARKPRRDPTLIKGVRQAHRIAAGFGWRAADGSLTSSKVTAPANSHERKLCRLVFLAPDIQRAILEGRQPPGLTLDRLLHSPIPGDWSDQRRAFEFAEKHP